MQPTQSYSVGGQRSSGQLIGKPADTRPVYRGHWCAVSVNYEVAELQARERVMLDFALAISRCDNITEEHFKNLEAHGFDREDAWDIAAIAAFFSLSNRIAHFTDMRPNEEFYSMGRLPREKDGEPKK
ncbi:UNVERIFIED_CONTAM: hypothetical protein FKN15_060175 [Acipenser sinensis]